jgi:serine/threonine-protein kinase HipA
MARSRKDLALGLWMNGQRIGAWHINPNGDHELRYDPDWVESPLGRPVSLSMPLRPASVPYRGAVVHNFFENLLPENRAIRQRIARRFQTTADAFDLLGEIGRDCVGALQLLPIEQAPRDTRRIQATPLSEAAIERHLATLAQGQSLGTGDDGEFRLSLAGVQDKTAFLWHNNQWCRPGGSTPTTHIFKLPMGVVLGGINLATSVENEWLAMEVLRAFDVPVAKTAILRFGERRVLGVERFDRRWSNGVWLRLPQEDFAQVFGVGPDEKYEERGGPGIRGILNQLTGSSDAEVDRRDFFRTQVVFWMLAAIDGHAKNFSLFIEPRGRFRLAPRYDVLSAHPMIGGRAGQLSPQKVRMAMTVWGKNRHYRWSEIRREHFEHTAADCRLLNASDIIDSLVAQTPRAIDSVSRALPRGFPASVAEPIFAGITRAAKTLS